MHQHKTDIKGAMNWVHDYHKEVEAKFMDLYENKIPKFGEPVTSRWPNMTTGSLVNDYGSLDGSTADEKHCEDMTESPCDLRLQNVGVKLQSFSFSFASVPLPIPVPRYLSE